MIVNTPNTYIELTHNDLKPNKGMLWVQGDGSGAINVFIGSVRNKTANKIIQHLEFEAHESMALKELNKIVVRCQEKWPIHKIWIQHRLGLVEIGAYPVVICVSTAHRAASFAACQFIIDELKKTVPIWKKELSANGEEWVSATP